MFEGHWLTYKLNDAAPHWQGVYIIEARGVIFHVGQTEDFERRRSEHVRSGTCNAVLDANYRVMGVLDNRLFDGLEAYLGRVLAAPTDKRYPNTEEIACNLPSDVPMNALAWPAGNALEIARRYSAVPHGNALGRLAGASAMPMSSIISGLKDTKGPWWL